MRFKVFVARIVKCLNELIGVRCLLSVLQVV